MHAVRSAPLYRAYTDTDTTTQTCTDTTAGAQYTPYAYLLNTAPSLLPSGTAIAVTSCVLVGLFKARSCRLLWCLLYVVYVYVCPCVYVCLRCTRACMCVLCPVCSNGWIQAQKLLSALLKLREALIARQRSSEQESGTSHVC